MNKKKLAKIIPKRFWKLEYAYLFIALLFGFIFIALIPPGWNPDEHQHYWRTQSVAHGNFVSTPFPGPGDVTYTGSKMSDTTAQFISSYRAMEDWPNLRLNFPMTANDGAIARANSSGPLVDVNFPATSKNTPFVYLPQSLAFFITNSLGVSLLIGFVLAKLFGLAVHTFAFFMAIKYSPKGKWIFFTIGLLPMTVVQSVALGADVMTTALCVLFTALILKIALADRLVSKRHFILLFILIAGLSLVKIAYLPLVLLALLIPLVNKHYKSWKFILRSAATAILCILPGVIWYLSVADIPDNYSNTLINGPEQLQYLKDNPIRFIGVIIATYLSDAHALTIWRGLFGSFIWDTAQLPIFFNFLGAVILGLSLFMYHKGEDKKQLPISAKLMLWGVFLILLTAITIALYMYYTSVGAASALGIQGRYFLPLLPLAMIAIATKDKIKSFNVQIFIALSLVAMLVSAVIVVWGRIYA